MILKSFEIEKINNEKNKNYLFYGENNALINELVTNNFKTKFKDKIYNYEENEITKNEKNFFDNILTSSFFENEKLIIVSRCTDKILKIAEEIVDKEIQDLKIIFLADNLEKKSKLRNFFEKNDKTVCVAFYPDNQKTLSILVNNFFRKINYSVSQEIINIIVEKSNGDRQSLKNELSKIENLTKSKKKIELSKILKLINVSEKNNISELVDVCLAKKQQKVVRIMNENNFSNEEAILIIRIFLNKTKRLIKLKTIMKENQNIDNVLSGFKPPIFWKDKELVKDQLKKWSDKNIETLFKSINETELSIKKNFENSIKILFNFIFTTSKIN